MSDDGSYVFFQSPVGLTPGALNDVQIGTEEGSPTYAQNVYEWHEGKVSLISDGRDTSTGGGRLGIEEGGNSSVVLLGSDRSGANVFFQTADRLVPQDTDTQADLYDARIGGGFPNVSPAPPCAGEGCRAAPAGPLGLAAPASASFTGAGNAVAQSSPAQPKAKAPKKKHRAKKKTKRKRKRKGRGSSLGHGRHGKSGRN